MRIGLDQADAKILKMENQISIMEFRQERESQESRDKHHLLVTSLDQKSQIASQQLKE